MGSGPSNEGGESSVDFEALNKEVYRVTIKRKGLIEERVLDISNGYESFRVNPDIRLTYVINLQSIEAGRTLRLRDEQRGILSATFPVGQDVEVGLDYGSYKFYVE